MAQYVKTTNGMYFPVAETQYPNLSSNNWFTISDNDVANGVEFGSLPLETVTSTPSAAYVQEHACAFERADGGESEFKFLFVFYEGGSSPGMFCYLYDSRVQSMWVDSLSSKILVAFNSYGDLCFPVITSPDQGANQVWGRTDNKRADDFDTLKLYDTTSDVPAYTYDRTAFLSGMAMGLTGKGDPISGMAVSGGGASGGYYSYNGVLLPELPEWDETAFPYAIVASGTLTNGIFLAQLTVSNKPIIVDYLNSTDTTPLPYIQAGATYAQCGVYSGASESEFESLFGSALGSIQNIEDGWSAWSDAKTTSVKNWLLFNATWVNHNLTFPNGTAYLAASEPAFAGTIKVYYEGTEPCAYSSVFGAYVSAELLNEPGPSVGDTVYVIWDGVLYEDVVTTAAAFGNAPMFGDLTLSTRPYVIGYMDIDGNGEAGWFFATGTSGEHTLKVYKLTEASGGSDSFVKGYLAGAALRRKRVIPESSGVYDDAWPVEWNNTLMAGNNPSVMEGRFVKASNLTPTPEEMAECVLEYTFRGTPGQLYENGITVYDNCFTIMFGGYAVRYYVVTSAGYSADRGITFPETGIYVTNYGINEAYDNWTLRKKSV